jgi:hypothetical protein
VPNDPPPVHRGAWPTDPGTAGALRRALVAEAADRGWPLPEDPAEQTAVLWAARLCLRRRLLRAEGVDTRTGQPVA